MVILVHKQGKPIELLNSEFSPLKTNLEKNLTLAFFSIAQLYPDELLIWCEQSLLSSLNISALEDIFHHKYIFASYAASNQNYLPKQIGYVDFSFFLKKSEKKRYPTWLASAQVGGIHSMIINDLKLKNYESCDFNYFLNSFTKRAMMNGLFCYSEPNLLRKDFVLQHTKKSPTNDKVLFKFVKQHYKWTWSLFLWFSILLYEKRIVLVPMVVTLFTKRLSNNLDISNINAKSFKKVIKDKTVDVIIPTIGRKHYLYDVLKDLSRQTHMPNNVIIIEQNPDIKAHTELDYINKEDWPFTIKHIFTHQCGVVNARNLALTHTKSEWIFLNDDDNRFDARLIENLLLNVSKYGVLSGVTTYLQPHEKNIFTKTTQSNIFGAGNAIIHKKLLELVKFDSKYEFNYGEDADFGMQIKYSGYDVIYFSNTSISHLKAPAGGYRVVFEKPWDKEKIKPFPSPAIMNLYSTYFTKSQMFGYKMLYFFKRLRSISKLKVLKFVFLFEKQWKQSEKWAKNL